MEEVLSEDRKCILLLKGYSLFCEVMTTINMIWNLQAKSIFRHFFQHYFDEKWIFLRILGSSGSL